MSEVRLVDKKYAGKPGVTGFLLRLVGGFGSGGPYDYFYSDGYVFRPYPRGMNTEKGLADRGCSDPTGMKFQKYVDAAGLGYRRNGTKLPQGHYVNWLELDH